ncbi:hypothetical protein [Streptomyces sp. NPDC018347]|uniref:hypothetical protein n=1 Tax=Streptomyces sp. NPDC018347 TaxID=3157193 RepID=UPI0033F47677
MAALVRVKAPSPVGVKDHCARAEPADSGTEVTAEPPDTWASARPVPPVMRYPRPVSTGGAAGAEEATARSAYSPEEPCEQPKEQ